MALAVGAVIFFVLMVLASAQEEVVRDALGGQTDGGAVTYSRGVLSGPGIVRYSRGVLSGPGVVSYRRGVFSGPGGFSYSRGVLSGPGVVSYRRGVMSGPGGFSYSRGVFSGPGGFSYSRGALSGPGGASYSRRVLSGSDVMTNNRGVLAGTGGRRQEAVNGPSISLSGPHDATGTTLSPIGTGGSTDVQAAIPAKQGEGYNRAYEQPTSPNGGVAALSPGSASAPFTGRVVSPLSIDGLKPTGPNNAGVPAPASDFMAPPRHNAGAISGQPTALLD